MNRRNRFVIQLLVALVLVAFTAQAADAANDLGPPESIAAIRREVPKLLANRMSGDGSVSVTGVVTDGVHAVAIWQGGGNAGIVVMRERNGFWWFQGFAAHPPHRSEWTPLHASPPTSFYCGSGENPAPAASDLVDRFAFPVALAQSAAVAYAEPGLPSPKAISVKGGGTLVIGRYVDCVTYQVPSAQVDGYALNLDGLFSSDRMPSLTVTNATPESATRIAHLVDLTISSSEPLAASKLNVWCPWPLDPVSRYTLKLRLTNGREQLVAGSLDNANNLHFVLPPIPIVPLAVTRGTISVHPPATALTDGI